MRLNHPDYIKLVTEVYKKKRANNELPPLLAQSTPGNIRLECANVYQERYEKKDEPTLRAFFGPGEQDKKFLAAIRDFHINRFKSLDKYFKENGKKGINDRNLNLLAWLIDFEHRPYTFGMEVKLNEEERMIIEGSVNGVKENNNELNRKLSDSKEVKEEVEIEQVKKVLPKESEEESMSNPANNTQKNTFKKVAIIFLILVISFAGISIIGKYNSSGKTSSGNRNTSTIEKKDTISKSKADSLISNKSDHPAVATNTNKSKLHPPIVLDSSHCLQITKKGTQCKRKAKNNGYCWQHGG